MARILTAAAQLGPMQRAEGREAAVARMVRLMERAHARGAELVVFPELALTTLFPRHYLDDPSEADQWFETAMPSNATAPLFTNATAPLFTAAKRLGIGFHLVYAEIAESADETGTKRHRHFNTVILVAPGGDILLKYRKAHLPSHAKFDLKRAVQHLEKRYFEVGDLSRHLWLVPRISA